MPRPQTLPPLWRALCAHVRLPDDSSIDRVHVAYGKVVGRGTIQRIHDGTLPNLSSLKSLADHLHIDVVTLQTPPSPTHAKRVSEQAEPSAADAAPVILPPRGDGEPTFLGFEKKVYTASDFGLLEDLKMLGEEEIASIRQRAAAVRAAAANAEVLRVRGLLAKERRARTALEEENAKLKAKKAPS